MNANIKALDIKRWERELRDLKNEKADPKHIAKIELFIEGLYLRAFELSRV